MEHYAGFRVEDDPVKPLALHLDVPKVIQGHRPFSDEGDVALIWDATRRKYWIRYRNNTSFRSEVNWEHAGESYMSLRSICFILGLVKLKTADFAKI